MKTITVTVFAFWLMAQNVFAPAITELTTVAQFTNAVNSFNPLSIDGLRRTIHLGPGTFALPVGTYRMHVSNNICIKGSGPNQTTITGIGTSDSPIMSLYDNCEISDLKIQSSGTGANPQLGFKADLGGPTSTNVVVKNVWLSGDDDNLWLSLEGSYWDSALGFVGLEWRVYDTVFENRFDSVFITGTENGVITDAPFTSDGPCILRMYNCRLWSQGPSLDSASRARGDVSNMRILGQSARVEVYGSTFYSAGGTNLTTIAFLGSGPSGADSAMRWPGGLYLNNCQAEVIGTNLVAGGVGGCLIQSTNGWAFLNNVQANSNNIVGTGTNFYSVPLNRGWANSVSLIADNQVVNPRLSKYIKISSDNGTAGNRTFTIVTSFLKQGDELKLEWVGTNAGEIVDDAAMTGGGNVRLSATWTPTQYDVLLLEFNGTDLLERSRSAN